MAGMGEGVPGAPRRGGWGGTAQAARGPSAGSLLPLPGARRRPGGGRSSGVCGGAGRSGGGGERGRERSRGKGEERKGERGERGDGRASAGWGGVGGASRLLASLPVPWPGPWVSLRCPPPGSPRPARPLAPSLSRSHTNKMAAVVSSLSRVLGGKRAAAAAAGNEPREKGGGARPGGGARRRWRTQWNAGGRRG